MNQQSKPDLSSLKPGQVYKNYKELCSALGESVKSGNAKPAQLEHWLNFFSFKRSGHKFIIEDIYEQPKVKLTKKYGYVNELEELIANLLLLDENKGVIFLSKNRLFRYLNIVNDNYNFGRYNIDKLGKLIDVDTDNKKEFYDLSRTKFARSIETALDRLKDKSLVFWSSAITVCFIDSRLRYNEASNHKLRRKYIGTNDYNQEQYSYEVAHQTKQVHREATEEEIQKILKIERQALDAMGIADKQTLIKRGMWEKFLHQVREQTWEDMNILFYYESYKIIFKEEYIEEFKNEVSQDLLSEKVAASRENINVETLERLERNANTRYQKAVFNFVTMKPRNHRIDDKYVEYQKRLADTLIDVNCPDIRRKIKETKINKQQ